MSPLVAVVTLVAIIFLVVSTLEVHYFHKEKEGTYVMNKHYIFKRNSNHYFLLGLFTALAILLLAERETGINAVTITMAVIIGIVVFFFSLVRIEIDKGVISEYVGPVKRKSYKLNEISDFKYANSLLRGNYRIYFKDGKHMGFDFQYVNAGILYKLMTKYQQKNK